ncbi:PAS domain-containing protein [Azonexus fungiphilus]|uniref:PAS domain-containing protein n=1 Tax=Azonexus fungiphilus TaxID=146940 RepID=UPI00156B0B07|nr:PAS domain-containing protein [Azonexus fungiphilus]NHC06459.1 PAS domain-containing protein [Azonexus fungiphilus]
MPGLDLSWLGLATIGGAALLLALLPLARLQREKRHFRAIFDNATVGMARSTASRRWIEVNPALCRMLGAPAEVLTSCDWIELTHPDDREINLQLFDAVLRDERDGFTLEKRFLRPDGSVVFVNLAAQAIRLSNRQVDYFTVIIEDITQRQLAEKQFASQVDRSTVLIELPRRAESLDERDFMQYALERAEALTGSRIGFMHFLNDDGESIELVAWSRNTLEKYCNAVADRHYPISQAGIWADAARTGCPLVVNDYASADNRRGLPDGHSQLVRLLSIPVVENGSVRMMAGVGNKDADYDAYDVETVQLIANETWRIVRRQRADKALRLAMQVVNASPAVCFRWSASNGWPVVFVSDNVRQWGYSPAQLQSGQPDFASIVHPDDLPRIVQEVMRHTAEGVPGYEQEYRLITAEKQVIWVVDRTQVTRDEHGLPVFYDGVLTDISERKRQQQQLAENLAHQQQLNKRLEEANNQLLQSEKMASIGQLAAGIAHELNNPIGFVHSNLGTLDGYLNDLMTIVDAYATAAQAQGDDSPGLRAIAQLREERDFDFIREDIFKLLAESKDGLGRVRKIVQDLKTFSRVGEQEWQEADLHQGIDSTLNIVWNELKYKCRVVKEYGELPPVYCLISQLNQVFMNLLVNAGHAIEQQGTITIRSGRLDGERVFIEIADTGCGIAPENQRRIFEPFFTTKPIGKGTGLGLSVSYNIVQRHQGEITVDSVPGQGTTFRIVLPIRPASAPVQEQHQ